MKSFIRNLLKDSGGQSLKDSSAQNHYQLLQHSGVNWGVYAKDLPFTPEDPIQLFLDDFEQHPLKVKGWFDSAYYLETNADVRLDRVNPLVHFLLYGRREGRPAYNPEEELATFVLNKNNSENKLPNELDSKVNSIEENNEMGSGSILKTQLKSLLVKEGFVPEEFNEPTLERWLDDLIEVSEYGGTKIEGFFDQALYEAMYPDIARAPINSFHHFVSHGYTEGRAGWLDMDSLLLAGRVERDESRDTVLVVSHDASATGAPAVALEVARRLSKHFNVITATLKGGTLRDSFIDAGTMHLDAPHERGIGALEYCLRHIKESFGLHTVLLNSVESMNMAEAAVHAGLPTMSLLHEFAEYTRPVGKVARMLLTADLIVYPAESLKQSGLMELRRKAGIKHTPNNIRIQPQGYLGFQTHIDDEWSLRDHLGLSDDQLVIVGAGHVQPRKGVDWFLETCHHLYEMLLERGDKRADKLQFVWLGNGYDENDTLVSVWLDAYIQRTGLENRVHFPGAVHDVAAALESADLYLLTSRLDPFPNVAVDALNADCGIGVFEQSSGIADFVAENDARAVIGRYGDPYHLAGKIADKLNDLIKRDGKNARICREKLDFDRYVTSLAQMMEDSAARRNEIHEAESVELFNESFDATFYGLTFDHDNNRQNHFLSLLRKGVALSKPFPGSDIQAVLDQHGTSDFNSLLEKAMTTTVEDMPLRRLRGVSIDNTYGGRIALQFHVYFADLIPEYCAYFKTLQDHDVDLFVSHIPELDEEHIKQLEESVTGELYLRQFDNRGRDVYPFHCQFVDDIEANYDIVGHFHTKKSGDIADGIGDRWRRYLLGNLIGSQEASREVLSLFNDANIGLVFAEDHHLVDEGDNAIYIESLLGKLGVQRRSHYRHFPLGTMFWARTDALSALKSWPEDTFDLPEPVPYDGSVLHAFERLLPQLVQEKGFEVKRVYTENTYW